MGWYARTATGWIIDLHVQPGARRSEVAGLHGARLKLRIQAPPVDGKANQAVIAFIAARLGLAAREVSLVSGATSREKRLAIDAPEVDPARLLDDQAS